MNRMEKERNMIRLAAQKTAEKIVLPRAADIDATEEFPWDIVDAFGKQGFLSIILPEEYGGMNGDIISFCCVVEEIAKVSGSSSLLILAQGIGTLPLWIGGSSEQKEKYFTEIVEKNFLVSFALAEYEGKYNISSLKTIATKDGNNYRINGRKGFVVHGSIANLYIVFATSESQKGISAFIVDAKTPGIHFGNREDTIGMKGCIITDLILENCLIPEKNILGKEGEGLKIALNTITKSQPPIGAQAVGIAQGALEHAIRYANERFQFGKPIASFQALRFMIADMATQIEAARSLVYNAAKEVNKNTEQSIKISAIAKCFASEMAMKVTTDAVQVLGGYGYMKDYPLERMMRDAKVTQIYEGPIQFQKLLIADQLIKS
jgi:alkylation response protein AidB-like acyl-CoA dehydrogenase